MSFEKILFGVNKLIHVFWCKEFIKFIIIGIINTFNGTFFSMMYSYKLDVNTAFIIGYLTSLSISYILNSYIVFRERLEKKKFLKFIISYIPNFIIQNIIVLVCYNILGIPRLYVYILAAVIGVPVTFLCVKFFAFKKK